MYFYAFRLKKLKIKNKINLDFILLLIWISNTLLFKHWCTLIGSKKSCTNLDNHYPLKDKWPKIYFKKVSTAWNKKDKWTRPDCPWGCIIIAQKLTNLNIQISLIWSKKKKVKKRLKKRLNDWLELLKSFKNLV